MKYLFYILITLIANMLFAQKSDYKEDVKIIQGEWFLTAHGKSGDMTFEKADFDEYRWGYYLRILPDGKLSVGYSAPCGNDPNRFHEEGKWSYNNRTNAFITTIDVHKRGKVFTIKFISNSKMVLE